MKWLTSFFEESPGVNSMTRGVLFAVLVFCVMVPSLAWAIGYLMGLKSVISNEILTFFATIFGSSVAGKAIQSFAEK